MMGVLAVAGCAVCLLWNGARGAASFLIGAGLSAGSFWSLQYLTASFTAAVQGERPGGVSTTLLLFRFFILAGAAYGILRFYEVHIPATGLGLSLAVLAITLEAIFELIYARA